MLVVGVKVRPPFLSPPLLPDYSNGVRLVSLCFHIMASILIFCKKNSRFELNSFYKLLVL